MVDVSIIVPTYNSASHLDRCLGSIGAQKDIRAELHVIDDNSKDDTQQKVLAFKQHNPHVDVHLHVRLEDRGQSTARNVGIDASKGDYIALLDSDDKFRDPLTLRKWVNAARKHDAEIVIGQYYVESLENGTGGFGRAVRMPSDGLLTDIYRHPTIANVSSCWQMLYKRAFLDEKQVRFSRLLRQREDRPFFINALVATEKVLVVPQVVVDHLMHSASSFQMINASQVELYLTHLSILIETFNAVRAAGAEKNDLFRKACYTLCIKNLLTYWQPWIVSNWAPDQNRSLVSKLFDVHRQFDDGAALATDNPLTLSESDHELVAEYTCDFANLLLRYRRYDDFVKYISGSNYTSAQYREFAAVLNPEERWLLTRHMIYNRVRAQGAAPSSTKANSKEATSRMPHWLGFLRGNSRPEAGPSRQVPATKRKVERDLSHIRLMFHPGTTKTGSSYLQAVLGLNRLRLLEQGICYPLTGHVQEQGSRRNRSPGHAGLVIAILDRNRGVIDSFLDEIGELSQGVHTVVLSAENLMSPKFWDNGASLRKIRETLPFRNYSVFAVHRNFRDWLKSSYIEMLGNPRNGFMTHLPEYVDMLCHIGLLNRQNVGRVLADTFGEDSVRYHAYEDLVAAGGVEKLFFAEAGIDPTGFDLDLTLMRNASLPTGRALCIYNLKKAGIPSQIIEEAVVSYEARGGLFENDTVFDNAALDELGSYLENRAHSTDVSMEIFRLIGQPKHFDATVDMSYVPHPILEYIVGGNSFRHKLRALAVN
jgi:glycosyltransferase involved in cell wall biosynthesis